MRSAPNLSAARNVFLPQIVHDRPLERGNQIERPLIAQRQRIGWASFGESGQSVARRISMEGSISWTFMCRSIAVLIPLNEK